MTSLPGAQGAIVRLDRNTEGWASRLRRAGRRTLRRWRRRRRTRADFGTRNRPADSGCGPCAPGRSSPPSPRAGARRRTALRDTAARDDAERRGESGGARGGRHVVRAGAVVADAPPMGNTSSTAAIFAAASTSGLSSPDGAGTAMTISATPGTRAGIVFISSAPFGHRPHFGWRRQTHDTVRLATGRNDTSSCGGTRGQASIRGHASRVLTRHRATGILPPATSFSDGRHRARA